MKFFKFTKKYKAYFIVITVLCVGAFYRRNENNKIAKAKTNENQIKPKTIMIHTGLHNRTIPEKRKYLLDNFDLDYVVGNNKAKITIIEYSSFTCKYCKKMRKEIKKILDEYVFIDNSQVRYAIRPLYNTKNIPLGAFLVCSKEEDKLSIIDDFFQLYNNTNNMEKFLIEIGKKYNMDETYVKDCIYNKEIYEKLIYMQQASRSAFNLSATPVFIINGKEFVGYKTYEQLKNILENILSGKQKWEEK